MLIAVYSDIHDNIHNLKLVFKVIKEKNINTAFCLGDFVNPGIIKAIIDSGIKTYTVFGNNDGEIFKIAQMAWENKEKITFSRTEFMEVNIANKKALLIHRHDLAQSLAKSGDFNAVFYGHDHLIFKKKLANGCLLANPGEISSHITGKATFMIWDTNNNSVEEIILKGFINVNS